MKPIYLDIDPSDGDELATNIADYLTISVEDHGIGSYEYWGAPGRDVNYQASIEEAMVTVSFDKREAESIAVFGSTSHTVGGCDGEHRGRCNHRCEEFDASFSIRLKSVSYEKEKVIAIYEITQ